MCVCVCSVRVCVGGCVWCVMCEGVYRIRVAYTISDSYVFITGYQIIIGIAI